MKQNWIFILLCFLLSACNSQQISQSVKVTQAQTIVGGGEVTGDQINIGGEKNQLQLKSDTTETLQLNVDGSEVQVTFLVSDRFRPALKHLQEGHPELAIDVLEKLDDPDPQILFNLANSHLAAGILDKALKLYTQLLAQQPDFADVYNNRGGAYLQLKRLEEASVDLEKAVQLNPESALPLYNLGVVYTQKGEYQRAIGFYTQALAKDAKHKLAYNNRGSAYGKLRQFEQALADLNQAIELAPEYAQAYHNRGVVYLNQDQLVLALSDFKQALSLKPQYLPALISRGQTHTRLDTYDQAIADFQAALVKEPDNAFVYENLGWTYLLARQFAPSELASKKSLELTPEAFWVKINLAHAHLFQNRLDDALNLYRTVRDQMIDGQTGLDVIFKDFKIFENKQLIHQNIDLARELLQLETTLPPPPLLIQVPTPIVPPPPPLPPVLARMVSCDFKIASSAIASAFGGSISNALSNKPEVTMAIPGRNSANIEPDTCFVLKFSEPIARKSIENDFYIMAYNSPQLLGDPLPTFTGTGPDGTSGSLIWNQDDFEFSWNDTDDEITLRFKLGKRLPTSNNPQDVPQYLVSLKGIQDKTGIIRDHDVFKLTDGRFEPFYKFTVQPDLSAPEVKQIQAQSAESGNTYGDIIQVVYSEPMAIFTRAGVIAGGLVDKPEARRQAPAGHPASQVYVTDRQVAKNYRVKVVRSETVIFDGSWAELGGRVIYDPTDPKYQTVLLLAPQVDIFKPGDGVTVTIAETITDPAGNPLAPLHNKTQGVVR